jgi:hypothetical protein
LIELENILAKEDLCYLLPISFEKQFFEIKPNMIKFCIVENHIDLQNYIVLNKNMTWAIVRNKYRYLIGIGDFIRKQMQKKVHHRFGDARIEIVSQSLSKKDDKIKSIIIQAEETNNTESNKIPRNQYSRVCVNFADGKKYYSFFCTHKYVEWRKHYDMETGDRLNGQYFCGNNTILVDSIEREIITNVINDLLDGQGFYSIFEPTK